jgi:YesN/AraC family two-component response regulator
MSKAVLNLGSRSKLKQLQQSKPAISLLIVEDEQSARAIIIRMIAMRFPDAVIYSAENGVMGEVLFKKHTPEIVITDINLPLKNGIEMIRAIRSRKPDTKCIVLTAHKDKIDTAPCMEIGSHIYLVKPIQLDLLFAAIEKCIEEIGVAI